MDRIQRAATISAIQCGITLRHSKDIWVARSAIAAIRSGIQALRENEVRHSLRAMKQADQAMQTWLHIPGSPKVPTF